MFALLWIALWAIVFDIFDDPSTGQIIGFVLIGLGGPVGRFLIQAFKD